MLKNYHFETRFRNASLCSICHGSPGDYHFKPRFTSITLLPNTLKTIALEDIKQGLEMFTCSMGHGSPEDYLFKARFTCVLLLPDNLKTIALEDYIFV